MRILISKSYDQHACRPTVPVYMESLFVMKLQILKENGQGASPRDIGDKIIKNLPQTDYFEKVNCHLILVKFLYASCFQIFGFFVFWSLLDYYVIF